MICNRECDPTASETRRLESWHYSDCSIWTWLDISLPHAREAASERPGGGA